MRKRFMNISKRCMVAIMSAAMLMSSVTVSMAFPVGVYAVDNVTDGAFITGEIETNSANNVTVTRYGHVYVNEGTITANNGTISINNENIENNNYSLSINRGTVTNNNFEIEGNLGTVTNNYDTVSNESTGTITNQYAGYVDGEGRIENYFDGDIADTFTGTVTNNYADITNDTPVQAVNAPNQFRSVTVSNNNITAEYGDEFVSKVVDAEGNSKQFIQVTSNQAALGDDASGLITISPKDNYQITGNDTEGKTDGPGNTFKYELREDGGKYYLTIYNPTQALAIDPTTLGLIISRIQNKENVSISNVIVDDSGDGGDQNPPSEETNNNVVTPANPALDRINTALKITPNAKELSVSFVTQTNLTLNDIKTLCETRPDLAKRCSITDKEGNIYELYIPANVAGMAGYEAALDKLKDQPNSLAGPLTICGIFKDLGFTCTKIANLKDLTVRGSNSSAANAVQPQTAAITNGNAVTAAVRNSVLQISADPASIGDAAYTSKFVESITNAPFGGTVKIATNDTAFLNELIVSCLETRNDVSLEMSTTVGGVSYVMNVPAAYNLRALLGADGKIDMYKLFEIFGTQR